MGYDGLWDLLGVENGAKPMAAEPTVDARWACLVADLLEAKQIEPEGLLRQAGLSRRVDAFLVARRAATQADEREDQV